MSDSYRTAPSQTETGMPSGVPYIIGNEAAERFSFYGMRSILIVFMTQYLVTRLGAPDQMGNPEARAKFSYFVAAVYFLPIGGALLAEGVWGKYRTIFWLSIVYCLGHFALALNDTRVGLLVGLGLISIGSGGIKPCVSANVGDQFGASNKHLLSKVYGWFYFSINAGSFLSTILCPLLLSLNDPNTITRWFPKIAADHPGLYHFCTTPGIGSKLAFGLPGIAMVIATIFFWAGRKKFVHVPPGREAFFKQFFSSEGLGALARIATIYIFIAVFWSLWDQSSGGSWTLQCKMMDLHCFGLNLLPEQVQTANPILILLFIPLVNYLLYPLMGRFFEVTPLRKIGIGLALTAASYLVIAHIQTLIDAGGKPTVWWQFFAYVILTLGEAMVSITGLEFSYTQAPDKMKSAIMAAWLFTVSLGNIFTGLVNSFIQNPDHTSKMSDYHYYLFFAGLMFVTTAVYVVVASFYKGRTYLQGEAARAEADIAAVITRMPPDSGAVPVDDSPPPAARTPRWLAGLTTALLLGAFVVGMAVQFRTGLADNGDFTRSIKFFSAGPVGIRPNFPPPHTDLWRQRFFHYWLPRWSLRDHRYEKVVSSAVLLWLPGVLLAAAGSWREVSLPWLSLVPRALLFGELSLLLRWAGCQPQGRWLPGRSASPWCCC